MPMCGLLPVCPVHATINPLQRHADAHILHKPIKTERHSELTSDIHGSQMKSSVIRIPHEYG